MNTLRQNIWIKAPNLSQGFHGILFDMATKFKSGPEVLMIAENPAVADPVKAAMPWANLHFFEYSGSHGVDFEVDMNVRQEFDTQYDVVISQALLEHVCRPSVVIENKANLLKSGGVMVLHTHGPAMGYHGYPIDCVRFYKDFFEDLCKYLPIELIDFHEEAVHIFAAYKKK
jgi:SAM-dependent methyltransferase